MTDLVQAAAIAALFALAWGQRDHRLASAIYLGFATFNLLVVALEIARK